jgi:hypothetical protein
VVENFHRTKFHPQKDMHHNSQGMTENHPDCATKNHPGMDRTNL